MKKIVKEGFTLVELLVAIAILSVLVLFALPNVLKAFSNARKQSFLNEAKVVFRESNKKFVTDSFIDAATNSFDSKNNKLSINAGELDYCVKLENNGKIQRIGVGNDSYHILYETIDGIDDMKIEHVQKGRLTDELCDNLKNGVITLIADNGKVRNDNEYHSSIKIKNNDSHDVELLANTGYKFDSTTCEDITSIKSEKLLSITPQNNDIECMVNFTEDTYEVTFGINEGETESEPNKAYYYYNHGWYSDINHENELTKLINVPTKVGYTYSNYSIDGTNIVLQDGTLVSSNKITESQTIYANYNTNEYSIICNLNGGAANNPTSYNIETNTIILNNPTKAKYTFIGWTGSNGTTPQKDVTISKGSTGNKEYTANFILSSFTVTYNCNGGTNCPNSQEKTKGVNLTLSSVRPTKNGNIFKGWSTTVNGTVSYGPGATYMTDSNITLYAKWEACAAGTYLASGSTATSCTKCSAGTYQNSTGQTSCKPCAVGTYQASTGKTSCTKCECRTTSGTGSTSSAACTVPYYGDGSLNLSQAGYMNKICINDYSGPFITETYYNEDSSLLNYFGSSNNTNYWMEDWKSLDKHGGCETDIFPNMGFMRYWFTQGTLPAGMNMPFPRYESNINKFCCNSCTFKCGQTCNYGPLANKVTAQSRTDIKSGTNTYNFTVPAKGEKTVFLSIRAGGGTNNVYISGLKFLVITSSGNSVGKYTLKQMVENNYIKPLVLMDTLGSQNGLNIYNGTTTNNRDYATYNMIFMLNSNYGVEGFEVYTNQNFSASYDDGYYYRFTDINNWRMTLKQ